MFRYLEDIILLILVFYIVRQVLGLLFNYIFRGAGSNKGGSAGTQGPATGFNGAKPDGKVKINFMPPPKAKKVDDTEGEFIDYEEIRKNK